MKLFWFVFAVIVVSCGATNLNCYTYLANSYNGIPQDVDAPLLSCAANSTSCAALSWTSKLSTSDVVTFYQGLCATPAVCRQFCNALYRDSLLGPITNQCQHQCCNSDGCNKVLH